MKDTTYLYNKHVQWFFNLEKNFLAFASISVELLLIIPDGLMR